MKATMQSKPLTAISALVIILIGGGLYIIAQALALILMMR